MKICKTLFMFLGLFTLLPTGFASAEDNMVRIPAEGDTTTGYTGCPIDTSIQGTCDKADVKAMTIKAFMMDVHEVTKGELDACFEAGDCTIKHNKTTLDREKNVENWKTQPAKVSYDQADEYCKAMGKRLPTQEEWLAAAMSDTVKNYTWGDTYEKTDASIWTLTRDGDFTESVMSYPKDFSQGVYDLSGSTVEWIESPLRGDYREGTACVDQRTRTCMGSLNFPLYQPMGCFAYIEYYGFRCVKDVP